ncbi:unnamed protein product [Arctogadus glacialis]
MVLLQLSFCCVCLVSRLLLGHRYRCHPHLFPPQGTWLGTASEDTEDSGSAKGRARELANKQCSATAGLGCITNCGGE